MSETESTSPARPDIRVAVVEDHVGLRTVISRLLQYSEGVACCGLFDSGRDALNAMAELKPDIVTLDLSMPDMDGLEVLDAINKGWPEIQCILVSGHDEESYARQALDQGARGYILKGDAPELILGIREVAAGKRYVSPRFHALLPAGEG